MIQCQIGADYSVCNVVNVSAKEDIALGLSFVENYEINPSSLK
jgi:hypothetical protein